jgi:hypothetical protein
MIRAFFVCFPFVVFAMTMFTFVRPACRAFGAGTRAQVVCAVPLLLCFSKFLCYKAFGGDEFSPELPLALIWTWNWLYSGAMILFALSLVLRFLPGRVKPLLLPALAWSISAVGLWNGVRTPDVREVEVVCPELPAALDGYRIVQVADVHVSAAALRRRTAAIVALANAADADLAVCTGDIVDGSPLRRRDDVEPLKDLRAKDGVYFVTGNHEFYGDWDGWLALYREWGIRFLRNECVFPREGLALGGVDDSAVLRWRRRGAELPDVGKAFAAATNCEFRVLLQHKPKYFEENATEHGVGLQLSGHTHGGAMPGLNLLVSYHNNGFVRGVYGVSRGRLHVSPGCGQWAGFPMRFFDDPEVSVITLRRGDGPER